MKRPPVRWVIAYSLLVLVGCQNPGGGMAPFGRTTIPSPRTRTAGGSAVFADPYYSGAASTAPNFGAVGAQPSGTFPAVVPYSQPGPTTIPTPNFNQGSQLRSSSAPSGQWVAPGTLTRRIEPESSSFTSTGAGSPIALASAQRSSQNQVANASYEQIIVPSGQVAPSSTSHARFTTPRVARGQIDNRTASNDGRIDLSELPTVRSRDASAGRTGFRSVDTIRTVRTPPPLRSTTNLAHRSSATAGRYGYEQDYTWLRGRLEYSAGKRQWKLRYIPIDGQTDRYGGSVILPPSAKLEDYKAGDFVEVRGRLGRTDAEASDFAANYSISEITALR